jgi:hypothetical protein
VPTCFGVVVKLDIGKSAFGMNPALSERQTLKPPDVDEREDIEVGSSDFLQIAMQKET